MNPQFVFSAPGRTEICGNHTDHQRGAVLAAAVNLETVAEVTLNGSDLIRVQSEGYPAVTIDLTDMTIHKLNVSRTETVIQHIAVFTVGSCHNVPE